MYVCLLLDNRWTDWIQSSPYGWDRSNLEKKKKVLRPGYINKKKNKEFLFLLKYKILRIYLLAPE
jgi:hypothetical protein